MSIFSQPAAPSSGVDWSKYDGALLLIEPESVERVNTSFGEKDAIKGRVVVLDGEHAGDDNVDTLIFGTVLVSQLKQQLGQKVLGRLGTGNAKPGQKPPWILSEATADDLAKGEAWVKQNAPTVTSAAAPF